MKRPNSEYITGDEIKESEEHKADIFASKSARVVATSIVVARQQLRARCNYPRSQSVDGKHSKHTLQLGLPFAASRGQAAFRGSPQSFRTS